MHTDRLAEDAPERQLRHACAELDQRLRAGEAGGAEDWLREFPALAEDDDLAVELIYAEYLTREALGRPPSSEELCGRFPRWGDRLRRLPVAVRPPRQPAWSESG